MADNFNGLRIELRPHIGKQDSPLGIVSVEHDQWIVMAHTDNAKPAHLGYLPKRPGAKLLYLADIKGELPPVFLAEIDRQCAAAAKIKTDGVAEEDGADGT